MVVKFKRAWPVSVAAMLVLSVLGPVVAVAREPGGLSDPGSARVSPVVGPESRISGRNGWNDERYPAVAYNPTANQYLAVWADGRDWVTREKDIYGQRVGANGNRLRANFRISGWDATDYEWYPAVAYNSTTDQYLVVWEDRRNDETRGDDIYGRRVAADGKRVGANFRISSEDATEDEGDPAVAYNPTANQFLVVWEDRRNYETRGFDVYGQRVAANGRRVRTDFRISGKNATAQGFWPSPAVTYNPTTDQYLVVWSDGRNDETRGWDIYGRRVAADGKRVGADFRISGKNAIGDEWNPAVAHDPTTDQFLVVWEDGRNDETRGWDIYGRRVAADGKLVGADFRISGKNATRNEGTPAVAHNPTTNQYLVVWSDGRNEAGWEHDIYGQRVAANGTRVGYNFQISGKNATEDEGSPALTYNPTANQYLVVWQDRRNYLTWGYDIYGQRVAANGTRVEYNFRIGGGEW